MKVNEQKMVQEDFRALLMIKISKIDDLEKDKLDLTTHLEENMIEMDNMRQSVKEMKIQVDKAVGDLDVAKAELEDKKVENAVQFNKINMLERDKDYVTKELTKTQIIANKVPILEG